MKNHAVFAFCFAVAAVLIFYWPLAVYLYQPVSFDYPDTHLSYFLFEHYRRVVVSGDWNNIVNTPMFYGFGKTVLFSEHLLGQALTVVPLALILNSTVAATNLFVLITVVSSFLAMYALAYYWNRNMVPSLVAGLVYSLGPYAVTHTPQHANLYTMQFLPLILLSYERMRISPSVRNAFLLFSFAALQAITGLNYAVFALPVIGLYIMIREGRRFTFHRYLNVGSIIGALLLMSVILTTGLVYRGIGQGITLSRPVSLGERFSMRPIDLLFSAPAESTVYAWLRGTAESLAHTLVDYDSVAEGSIFIGIIPFVFLVAALIIFLRKKGVEILWVGLFIVALLFSFGPSVHITDSISFPGPYRILSFMYPLMAYFRAPERFGVFAFLFLGLLIARALEYVTGRFNKYSLAVCCTVLVGIMVEYHRLPLRFVSVPPDLIRVYSEVDNDREIPVILELPINNNIPVGVYARSILADSHYLLWGAVLHHKKLLNGYSGTIPDEYYKRANALTLGFPSREKLADLYTSGVRGIVIHKDEYSDNHEYDRVNSGLLSLVGEPILSMPEVSLYKLKY